MYHLVLLSTLGFPSIFAIIIIFVIWFTYKRKKSNRIAIEKTESFWDNELAANATRRKPLSSLDYIIIPMEILPFIKINDERLIKYITLINDLSNKQIVNLTGLSNTQLKLMYGAPNLYILTEYDENYTLLVRTLNSLGLRLYELGYINESTKILEYAISINTDVGETYRLLADIYKQTGYPHKIDELLKTAASIKSLSKNSIINYLTKSNDSPML